MLNHTINIHHFDYFIQKRFQAIEHKSNTFFFLRLSGNGNEKHFRKDSGRGRFAKSPEQMETTYSMTTIEEEQENVSVALSLRNLSQLEDNNSIKSFNEFSDD